SKGIINDAISVYNAKAKENQVAQYHIERAEEHAKEELKKKNINIGDFEQKVDIILNNVISKGVYFTDKSEISRTGLINHIKSDNVTVVPTKEGYNRYYIDGKEVEASGEMISAMRSYERENANL